MGIRLTSSEIRSKFKKLTLINYDPHDIKLLRILGQLMLKYECKNFDIAIKKLYLITNGDLGSKIIIDHGACEILRGYLLETDKLIAPFDTDRRLREIKALVDKLNLENN